MTVTLRRSVAQATEPRRACAPPRARSAAARRPVIHAAPRLL